MGWDLLGPEGAGILLFVEQLDSSHTNPVVIEVEFFGLIDRMADLDALTDIGGRDFVESTLEANGGVVIDDPFMADQEDLIEFGSGEPADQDSADGSVIAIQGSFVDAGMEFLVVVLLEPESESVVELLQGDLSQDPREKPIPNGAEEAFDLSAGGAVIRLRVDQRDAGLGTTSS
jgi:hypothetical protein